MASKEIAAMLDALMGRNRNAELGAGGKQPTWEDDGVCHYFVVDFCPHDLFTNTKSDLGACPNIHDKGMKEAFTGAPMSTKKEQYMDTFLRMGMRMLSDADTKIKRAKERLVQDYREQLARNGVTPAQQEEIEMKIEVLTEKINKLVKEAEDAGEKGEVEEAQGILKLSEQLKEERTELQDSLVIKGTLGSEGNFGVRRNMEVCETCGAQFVSDSQARIDDHLMGKVHIGYAMIRKVVPALRDEMSAAREAMALERERELAERAARNGENLAKMATEGSAPAEGEAVRSRSREAKSKEPRRSKSGGRKRSRSRDRKQRSRSRDRRKRSRSRDNRRERKRSRSRDRKRSRSRDRKRSRSRERRDRRRSRSRDKASRRRRSRDSS